MPRYEDSSLSALDSKFEGWNGASVGMVGVPVQKVVLQFDATLDEQERRQFRKLMSVAKSSRIGNRRIDSLTDENIDTIRMLERKLYPLSSLNTPVLAEDGGKIADDLLNTLRIVRQEWERHQEGQKSIPSGMSGAVR